MAPQPNDGRDRGLQPHFLRQRPAVPDAADLNEWLPKDHLARFVVEMLDMLDLSAFYARRREDGWGRAAYDPRMMVAVLIYAYAAAYPTPQPEGLPVLSL